MFRKLDIERFSRPQTKPTPGPVPQLQWIDVKLLVVDDAYQRQIGKRGAANIRLIADNFAWSKFTPVIVAPIEGGLFAIVDGQHRTTAAILCGFETVPCQSVLADRSQQAAAYAAVNGTITRTTAQQLHHAKVAAGDLKSLEIAKICAAGGVTIVRRNKVQSKMGVGETQAVGALGRCLRDYGGDTLITALQCITQTSDGNAGFVRATIIEGLCQTLSLQPKWRDAGDALLRAMDDFSFPDVWGELSDGRDHIFPATVRTGLADKVRKHLQKKLPVKMAA